MNSYQLSGSRRREFDGQLAEPSRNSRVGQQDLAGLNSREKERTFLAVSPARFVTTVTSSFDLRGWQKKREKICTFQMAVKARIRLVALQKEVECRYSGTRYPV